MTNGPVNFLIVMADQLGAGSVGAYGNSVAKTPHMDRLDTPENPVLPRFLTAAMA